MQDGIPEKNTTDAGKKAKRTFSVMNTSKAMDSLQSCTLNSSCPSKNTRSLTGKELKEWKAQQLQKQNGCCALCGKELLLSEAQGDHNHLNEGLQKNAHRLRACLCRGCNTTTGALWKVLVRSGTVNRLGAEGALAYLSATSVYLAEDYTNAPFHPNRTKDETKRLKRLSKSELLVEATQVGVVLPEKITKEELVQKIIQKIR
ncbi:endonuclease domain-containing protein [Aeromonas hydrophila]|uniref:endonuclease domain-containing protein n=1 Tax=Aeromonas hydrophila TaxID=644 RepID=UPI0023798CE4|nr:endonuclease domain-containing protein [Aeromonas hydrophila]MDD9223485.1 endonuclease domain-containing protein [Aeromonas hydrophila]